MPNWCQGVLKIRGPKENHMRFFKEGIEGYGDFFGSKKLPVEDWFYKGIDEYYFQCPRTGYLYFKGTTRAFIVFRDSDEIYSLLYYDRDTEEDDFISVIPFKQAWDVDFEEFAKIAKQYGLDMDIFAVEKGMGFWQEGIIERDGTVYEKKIDYNMDYMTFLWNCPYPILGG